MNPESLKTTETIIEVAMTVDRLDTGETLTRVKNTGATIDKQLEYYRYAIKQFEHCIASLERHLAAVTP